ncbi:MAG: GNAT family N-acetyltransferase, partial [Woeseiales bacterium]
MVGYYAISAASVTHEEAISKVKRNAPDPISMGLIGRLAVRADMQGHRIGPALLRDAILRIAQASDHIGIKGVLVHALDEDAANFYAHHGFSSSPANDNHLM